MYIDRRVVIVIDVFVEITIFELFHQLYTYTI